MPVYGIDVEKRGPNNPSFANRYYTQAGDLEEAQIFASSIVDAENLIFATQVVSVNTHVWLPGAPTPTFSNQPRADAGNVAANDNIASEICVEVLFGTESSYPSTKAYRVQVSAGALIGTQWTTGYLTILEGYLDAMTALLPSLRTRNGGLLTSVAINQLYVFRQVGKGWYNRLAPIDP